jgi:hypothetical protein
MRRIFQKRSQALLDFVLIFGILIAFMVGLARIWVWFNANFAKRNVDYQNTRLAAGTANDSHSGTVDYQDQVLTIDDDWVFRGQASGSVGMPPVSTTPIDVLTGEGGEDGSGLVCASATEAATALRQQAIIMDEQAEEMHDFIKYGDKWYKPLFFIFMALGIDVDDYNDAIDELRAAADEVRTQADTLQNGACSGGGASTPHNYTPSVGSEPGAFMTPEACAAQHAALQPRINEVTRARDNQARYVQQLKDEGAPEATVAREQRELDNLKSQLKHLYILYNRC